MINNVEYNFDEEINRKNTNCAKYDGLKKYFGYTPTLLQKNSNIIL